MTASKKLTQQIEQELESRVEEPFVEPDGEEDSIFIDMTDHASVTGKALRVELRRTRDPATGRPSYKRKLVDPNYIIGLISPEDLPQEGKEFMIPYHSLNGLADFGRVNSREPIFNLVEYEDCFFFTTSEGEWRLKIIDEGN